MLIHFWINKYIIIAALILIMSLIFIFAMQNEVMAGVGGLILLFLIFKFTKVFLIFMGFSLALSISIATFELVKEKYFKKKFD